MGSIINSTFLSHFFICGRSEWQLDPIYLFKPFRFHLNSPLYFIVSAKKEKEKESILNRRVYFIYLCKINKYSFKFDFSTVKLLLLPNLILVFFNCKMKSFFDK